MDKSEHKYKFHEMLMLFSQGSLNTRKRLEKKYSAELIEEALNHNYIEIFEETDDGEIKYCITESGKKLRDY